MKPHPAPRPVPPSEEGYILLFAIFLMALMIIAVAVAAPDVAKSIQRDRDLEAFHRGMQYRRAIQLYYRSFQAYPPNVDALVAPNNIRFLRKKYIDPITNKVDWKPILYGQNKTPTAMGFFGQPLAGGATSLAGIGPSGGNTAGAGASGAPILPGGISTLFGGTPTATPAATSSGTTDNSAGTNTSSGANGTSTTGTSASGGSNSSTGSDQSGQNGQTFGGGGIIGFSPVSTKQSILIYKKKNHYNEWEFTYDPISDMQTMTGGNAGAIGQPAATTSNGPGSNIFGSSPSPTGSSSSPSTPATTPQSSPLQ